MSHGEARRRSQRTRIVALIWIGSIAVAVAASAISLFALNGSLYSASSFVLRYYDNITSDNIGEMLRTPGVAIDPKNPKFGLPAATSTALLRSGTISTYPKHVRIDSDRTHSDGSHTVAVDFELDGQAFQASYQIAPAAPLFGVINRWRFVSSPLQLLSVELEHGTHVQVGNLTLDARASSSDDPAAFSRTAHYLAVAPAMYTLSYNSDLVAAAPSHATVLPAHENSVVVDVEPTPSLVTKVQDKLDDFLAECVTQEVLQPTGCPFGATINDRVTGAPSWSIVSNPVVTLEPGPDGFTMPQTPGVVHLKVQVQSLYDGATSTTSQDVSYHVGLTLQLRDDGSLSIVLE